MKLNSIFLSACAAFALIPAACHADTVKVGGTYQRTFLVTDSSGSNVTGLTTSSFTATVSKAGGAAQSITTPAITEIGAGKYSLQETSALTPTIGALDFTLTASGATQVDIHDQVVGSDPAVDVPASILTRQPSGPVAVGSYAAGQDPATLLLTTPYITIPGDHTTTGAAEVLTLKQMLAIPLAVGASDNASTAPLPSSTATTSYYLAGLPAIAANLVYVSTVTYGAAGQQTGRTVKFANPFPAVN